MIAIKLLAFAVAVVAQNQATLHEICVLKCVRQAEISRAQAARLANIAGVIQRSAAERDLNVATYIAGRQELGPIRDRLLNKGVLSADDEKVLRDVDQATSAFETKHKSFVEERFRQAIQLFNDQQLYAIAQRKGAYDRAFKSANRVKTATAAEWPKVREELARLISDPAWFEVYSQAQSDYEQRTGKRTDVRDSGFSIKEAGIEDTLNQIRKNGREYVQSIRDAGASQDKLDDLASKLLEPTTKVLRTWPPLRHDSLGIRPDGVSDMDYLQLLKSDDSPYNPSRLIESFLTRLLCTDRAEEVLDLFARSER